MLNVIPLIGAILALLIGIIAALNKNQGKSARITLCFIALLNAHSLIESYLFYDGFTWSWLGSSYLHYHLTGILFYLYAHFLLKIDIKIGRWLIFMIIITSTRLIVLDTIDEDVMDTLTFTLQVITLTIDNFISIVLNITMLLLAFRKIRSQHFVVELSKAERLNYRWLKSLLIISIGVYLAVLISNTFSLMDEEWLIYFKIESMLNSIFTLAIVYSSLRFPVFSIHGDFTELSEESKKKYLNSSLSNSESDQIWDEIKEVMEQEKPFLNSEYRLNDLASKVNKTVHHVSQTINEKEGKNFSDFINSYRVQTAKDLLSSGRTKEVTILAVSYEAGFNSKTAFYNAFKKETGLTPTAFLKSHTS